MTQKRSKKRHQINNFDFPFLNREKKKPTKIPILASLKHFARNSSVANRENDGVLLPHENPDTSPPEERVQQGSPLQNSASFQEPPDFWRAVRLRGNGAGKPAGGEDPQTVPESELQRLLKTGTCPFPQTCDLICEKEIKRRKFIRNDMSSVCV